MDGRTAQALFHPQSIAIVGASRDPQKWGFTFLHRAVKAYLGLVRRHESLQGSFKK